MRYNTSHIVLMQAMVLLLQRKYILEYNAAVNAHLLEEIPFMCRYISNTTTAKTGYMDAIAIISTTIRTSCLNSVTSGYYSRCVCAGCVQRSYYVL